MYGQIHLEKSIRCISLYREQRHKKAEEVLHSHSGKASSQKTCVDVYFSTSHISMPNSNGLFAHPEKLRPDFVVKGRKRITIWDITNSSMPCW
jgi:hypothetical protein